MKRTPTIDTVNALKVSTPCFLVSAFILLLSPGCVSKDYPTPSVYTVNGVQYGVTRGSFFNRWWNFYERGRSFADGEFWVEAEADFRCAYSMNSIDDRRSKTYGLHFIQYFVNRELGITLFNQGQIKEAIPYLERSIALDQTEKAEFYLSLCRQQLSEKEVDSEKPQLSLIPIPTVLNTVRLTVAGSAVDNQYIDKVLVNGIPITPLVKRKQLSFEQEVNLTTDKTNFIEVVAMDTYGNVATTIKTVTIDLDAPVISLRSATMDKIVISVVDQHPVQITELKNIDSEKILTDPKTGDYIFKPIHDAPFYYVEVADQAQNVNAIKLYAHQLGSNENSNRLPFLHHVHSPSILLATTALVVPSSNSSKSTKNVGLSHTELPEIHTELPEATLVKVYQDHIQIAGIISGPFRNFAINGKTKIPEGEDIRFNYKECLELGEVNTVLLEVSTATHDVGYKTQKNYAFQRLPTPQEGKEFRAKVVLCPLAKDVGSRQSEEGLFPKLVHTLSEHGRFQMLAHKEEVLSRISREFRLIEEGWIKSNKAAKVGRFFDADYAIACTIRPTVDDIEIFGRLIDTASRVVLAHCDVYELRRVASDTDDIYKRFAEKLAQTFPVVQEKIGQTEEPDADSGILAFLRAIPRMSRRNRSEEITLGIGENANIKKGMKFIAYHRDQPYRSSVTNKILVDGEIIVDGDLVVKGVTERHSYLISKGILEPLTGERYLISR